MTMNYPSFRMFIDDTGDVSNIARNDERTRFASITGIIMEIDYMVRRFQGGFETIVERNFGKKEDGSLPILHRRVLVGPPREGPFSCLHDPIKREKWNADCLGMIAKAHYRVITVSVDKIAFYYHHPNWDGDVYTLLIQNAIERYFYFLRNNNATGDVMVEAQNPGTDEAIKTRYRSALESGTEHISSTQLLSRFTSREIKIEPKKMGISGLQLADLLARPAFLHCRQIYGEAPLVQNSFAASVGGILESEKYYRSAAGNPHGFGRVWRPQK